MSTIIGKSGLALCVALSVLGCAKTQEQESKMENMKDKVSDSAETMKDNAIDTMATAKATTSESADKMKDSAGEMKDSAGQYIDDSTITAKVKEKLVADPATSAYAISVETMNGMVQLSGFVQSAEEKSAAAKIAKAVPGVKSVKNDLILKSKTESMNDRWRIRVA